MKNINLFLISFMMIVIIAGCKKNETTPEEEILDTTEHDNYVQLLPESFSPAISYTYGGNHAITSGQPWGGVSSGGYHGGLQLDARAGRNGSSGPAEWFRSNASNAVSIVTNKNTIWPSELNFAFTGTLTINGSSYPVTLGQGHSGANNNWWIGGPGWVIPSSTSYNQICTPDMKYLISCHEVLDYVFWVAEN